MSRRPTSTPLVLRACAGLLAICCAMPARAATSTAPDVLQAMTDPASGRQHVVIDLGPLAAGASGGLSVRLGTAIEYRDRGSDPPALLREASLQVVATPKAAYSARVAWPGATGPATMQLLLVVRTESETDVRSYSVSIGQATAATSTTAVQPPSAPEQVTRPNPVVRRRDAGRPDGADRPDRPDAPASTVRAARTPDAGASDARIRDAFEALDARLRRSESSVSKLVAAFESQGRQVDHLSEQVAQWRQTRDAHADGRGAAVPTRVALGAVAVPGALRAAAPAASSARDVGWLLQSAVGLGLAMAAAVVVLALRSRTTPSARR